MSGYHADVALLSDKFCPNGTTRVPATCMTRGGGWKTRGGKAVHSLYVTVLVYASNSKLLIAIE